MFSRHVFTPGIQGRPASCGLGGRYVPPFAGLTVAVGANAGLDQDQN
jgi:hypothetical protein